MSPTNSIKTLKSKKSHSLESSNNFLVGEIPQPSPEGTHSVNINEEHPNRNKENELLTQSLLEPGSQQPSLGSDSRTG